MEGVELLVEDEESRTAALSGYWKAGSWSDRDAAITFADWGPIPHVSWDGETGERGDGGIIHYSLLVQFTLSILIIMQIDLMDIRIPYANRIVYYLHHFKSDRSTKDNMQDQVITYAYPSSHVIDYRTHSMYSILTAFPCCTSVSNNDRRWSGVSPQVFPAWHLQWVCTFNFVIIKWDKMSTSGMKWTDRWSTHITHSGSNNFIRLKYRKLITDYFSTGELMLKIAPHMKSSTHKYVTKLRFINYLNVSPSFCSFCISPMNWGIRIRVVVDKVHTDRRICWKWN